MWKIKSHFNACSLIRWNLAQSCRVYIQVLSTLGVQSIDLKLKNTTCPSKQFIEVSYLQHLYPQQLRVLSLHLDEMALLALESVLLQ